MVFRRTQLEREVLTPSVQVAPADVDDLPQEFMDVHGLALQLDHSAGDLREIEQVVHEQDLELDIASDE